jgi:simple sugar transport system ATP-binding protein
MDAGIGMVHQHFMLVPVFSVAENVVLGNEPSTRWGSLDLATARERVREISAASPKLSLRSGQRRPR